MILIFDTTSDVCSVALFEKNRLIAFKCRDIQKGHAEIIFPLIESVLGAAQVEINTIKEIGLTVGPGSFTGVRVGLSAAKGLALGLKIPIKAITSFEAMVYSVEKTKWPSENSIGCVLINANRGQLYGQEFKVGKGEFPFEVAGSPQIIDIENIQRWIKNKQGFVVHSHSFNVSEYLEINEGRFFGTSPQAQLFGKAFENIKAESAVNLFPLYLRPPDAIKMKPQLGLEI